MNSTVITPQDAAHAAAPRAGAVKGALAALRSLTRFEVGLFLLVALVLAAVNTAWAIEMLLGKCMQSCSLPLAGALMPLLALPLVIGGWLYADRAEASRLTRPARLALGLLVSVTAAVIVVPSLLAVFDLLPTPKLTLGRDETPVVLPFWVRGVSMWLEATLHTGLAFALLEVRRRHERNQHVLQAAIADQAQLSRRLLESRLAAMQAQVEPQFLFDSLVDVQATYDRDAAAGGEVMDRLITYLRVALPRLREQGSTVQAEVELLGAYLNVVAARHHGQPLAHFAVAPEAARERFYPMLLLPLVQRAIRLTQDHGAVPQRVELVIKRHGNELGALLRIDAPGLCADDPELARVRERLAGLYAERAQLLCSEPKAGCSEFVLRVPLT